MNQDFIITPDYHDFISQIKHNISQAVAQIPWGHIRLILDKIKERKIAEFYIQKIIENSWSRVILEHQYRDPNR